MKKIKTKRLNLVKPHKKYAHDMFEYAKSPIIGPMAGWDPHASIEVSIYILKEMSKSDYCWAIIYRADHKMIGTIDLTLNKDDPNKPFSVYELGYCISESYWGRGIVVEAANEVLKFAFNKLYADKIICRHFDYNLQSKRVIEKLGFKFIKYQQLEKFKKYGDLSCYYELTRKDFERNFNYD